MTVYMSYSSNSHANDWLEAPGAPNDGGWSAGEPLLAAPHASPVPSCSVRGVPWYTALSGIVVVALMAGSAFTWSHFLTAPTCGVLFRCGCDWSGASKCNAFADGDGPRCPWCVASAWWSWIPLYGSSVFMVLFGLVALALGVRLARQWLASTRAAAAAAAAFGDEKFHDDLLESGGFASGQRSVPVASGRVSGACVALLGLAVLAFALVAMVASYFAFTFVAALLTWALTDYPYFLWLGS